MVYGLGEPLRFLKKGAEIGMTSSIGGVVRKLGSEGRMRAFPILQTHQRQAKIAVKMLGRRMVFHRGTDQFRRLAIIPPLVGDYAQQMKCIGILPIVRQHLSIDACRLVKPALPVQRLAALDQQVGINGVVHLVPRNPPL
jgi:ribosomal protein S19